MIVKARAGQGGPALARYLEGGKNDHAEVLELRNLDAPSLKAAIYDMDGLARGSRCRDHALHVQLRAALGEHLSADQWREACDRYADAFGMQAHQAAIILHHQPDGTTHAHLVFNRVHPETLKAAPLSNNYYTHKALARQMERDWNLQQVPDRKRYPARDYSREGQPETEQARRQGRNVHALRQHIRHLWEDSSNGKEFADALEAEGYQLAKGDQRDYVVLDATGSPYSLGSRTTGAKAKEVREKLQDLDRDQIPDITEGRRLLQERQQERQHQRERKGRGEASANAPEPSQTPSPAMAWETVSINPEIEAKESRLLAVRLAEIERPTVGLWKATRGRQASAQEPKPASGLSHAFDQSATPSERLALVPKEPEPERKPQKETTSAHAERVARRLNAMMQKRRENEREDYTRDRGYEREP
jgi:hypothetical protein